MPGTILVLSSRCKKFLHQLQFCHSTKSDGGEWLNQILSLLTRMTAIFHIMDRWDTAARADSEILGRLVACSPGQFTTNLCYGNSYRASSRPRRAPQDSPHQRAVQNWSGGFTWTEKQGEKDQLLSLFAGNMSAACLQKIQPQNGIYVCVYVSVERASESFTEGHSGVKWHWAREGAGQCPVIPQFRSLDIQVRIGDKRS